MIFYRVHLLPRFCIAAGLLLLAWCYNLRRPPGWYIVVMVAGFLGLRVLWRGLKLLFGWVRVQV